MLIGMPPADQILVSAVNISEGRDLSAISEIAKAGGGAAKLLGQSSDPDHNRSVITLAGIASELVDANVALTAAALERLDLSGHAGVHPRMGIVDVIPFTPIGPTPMEIAAGAARTCARLIWETLGIPCFLYEQAAADPATVTLPYVRRHAFKELVPDYGDGAPHPRAGAVVVGARGWLVAFNANLDTVDVSVAKAAAAGLRAELGHLGVRALGLELPSRGQVQVSVNITRPLTTTLGRVLEVIGRLAADLGAEISDTEVVGLVPRACLDGQRPAALRMTEEPAVLEDRLDEAYSIKSD
jgi:glutamate formiminotransferase